MIDVAIIGCGPAGLSAAINVVQNGKNAVVFGKGPDAALLWKAEKVDNYLGIPDVTGKELMEKFYDHAIKKGVEFNERKVSQIMQTGDCFSINAENNIYNAKAIILATGVERTQLVKGESKFVGSGVSYCASCDAMLFMDKTVFVTLESESGEAEARILSDLCRKVYFLPKYEFTKPVPKNVEILSGSLEEIMGKGYVSAVKVNGKEIKCDGVFLLRESVPPSSLIFSLATIGELIQVDEQMQTNIKGVYAAGDCTGKPFQIAKAVGEGLIAGIKAAKAI
ncbi:MAG: FAD-dependent oxidoreductase [Firmicutes bacterium]|nr:FAD-dependent oxidoreductase [Bacillota bacterium]